MRSYRYMADVSSNNGKINLKAYSEAGHSTIAIKATESTDYVNNLHFEQASRAHELGLTVIHYHFCRPRAGNDVFSEINHFRDIYRKAWRDGDYVCVDLEVKGDLSVPGITHYGQQFTNFLALHTGHPVLLYTYKSFAEEFLKGVRFPGDRWWMAKYSSGTPSLPRGLKLWAWQYSDGQVGPEPHFYSGIGKCDGSTVSAGPALALYLRKLRTRKVK